MKYIFRVVALLACCAPLLGLADVDVRVSGQLSTQAVQPGGSLTITMTVSNGFDADEPARGMRVRLENLSDLSLLGHNAGNDIDEEALTWDVPDVSPGSQQRAQIYFQVSDTALNNFAPQLVIERAPADTNVSSQNLSNAIDLGAVSVPTIAPTLQTSSTPATTTAPVPVTAPVAPVATTPTTTSAVLDVGVLITATPQALSTGDTTTATITLTNQSSVAATDVLVELPIPNGFAFNGQADAASGAYNYATGMWSVPTLAAQQSTTLAIGLVVQAAANGSIMLITEIIDTATPESTAANEAPDGAQVQLSVTQTATPDPVVTPTQQPITLPVTSAPTAIATGTVQLLSSPPNLTELEEGEIFDLVLRIQNDTNQVLTQSGALQIPLGFTVLSTPSCYSAADNRVSVQAMPQSDGVCVIELQLTPGARVDSVGAPLVIRYADTANTKTLSITPLGAMLDWQVVCGATSVVVGADFSCEYTIAHAGQAPVEFLQATVSAGASAAYDQHIGNNFDAATQTWDVGTMNTGDRKTLTVAYTAQSAGAFMTQLNASRSWQSVQLTANTVDNDTVQITSPTAVAAPPVVTTPAPVTTPAATITPPVNAIEEPPVVSAPTCSTTPIAWTEPTTPAPSDISGHEYETALQALWQRGILTGQANSGAMTPDLPINRAEVSAVLARAARLAIRQDCGGTFLDDVPRGQWFTNWIETLSHARVINGYKDANGIPTGQFGVGDSVKYGEMSKMMLRLFAPGEDIREATTGHWASHFVLQMRVRRWVPDALLIEDDLNRQLTRGEVADMLSRALSL